MSQCGGVVESGYELSLSKPAGTPASARMYYMLDGGDPRMIGGGLNPYALEYSGPMCLTGDARVTARLFDGATWSPSVDATFDVAVPPPNWLAGDYDNTGTVDSQDYAVWRRTFGQSAEAYSLADGNGNGVVDAADYAVWRNNLGSTLPSAFSFNFIGQTYAENFDAFRGTEATLPDYFTIAVVSGTDIYRNIFDATTDAASSFTGIKAATSDASDYSLAWRESTGPANLDDTRTLFKFANNTGEAIVSFNVSYDVEAWVNGRRDNQLRFKYDVYADSAEAQAAEGRQAFETDIFATINPNHTPIVSNDGQFVLDGKDTANRVTVSGYVDLTTLLLDESSPGAGVFGALLPGKTAYFRWQISNGAFLDGNRSALGIDNIRITALSQALAASGGLAATTEILESRFGSTLPNATTESPAHMAALDLAIIDWSPAELFHSVNSRRLRNQQSSFYPLPSNSLLMIDLQDNDVSGRNPCEVQHEDSSRDNFGDHDEFFAELAARLGVSVVEVL
jgi:hypothetical protein